MKIYLLVEGEKTEMKLYPAWLSFLLPELKMATSFKSEGNNCYYMFCGQGIPSTYNHVANAIKDINARPELNYDYLIVCLDGENLGVEGRKQKLINYLNEKQVELISKCKLRIIVQNACVETCFLGNRKIVKSNPNGDYLKDYLQHYNVRIEDPELMPHKEPYKTRAQFHESYLSEVFKEHELSYRKAKPKEVLTQSYLEEIIKRTNDMPTHLNSVQEFFSLVYEIKEVLAKKQ